MTQFFEFFFIKLDHKVIDCYNDLKKIIIIKIKNKKLRKRKTVLYVIRDVVVGVFRLLVAFTSLTHSG